MEGGDRAELGDRLPEQLHALAGEVPQGDARDIPAGAGQARDEPVATGSVEAPDITIGMVRVASRTAAAPASVDVTITSTPSADQFGGQGAETGRRRLPGRSGTRPATF